MDKENPEIGGKAENRVSSSDQIVRDLVRGLYEGRYVAGQRLAEPDLMRRYGVGRSTVREAIKRLAAEGVITVHAYRGAQIRQLSRTEARNILLILELMIGLACRLAAANIGLPGRRAHFDRAYQGLLAFRNERDSYEMVRARNRFYRAITQIGGNKELDRILPSIQVHLVRTHLKQSTEDRFADYRAIAEAILAGDETGAEAGGRDHIRRTSQALQQLPDHVFAPEEQPSAFAEFTSEDAEDA